MAGEDMNEVFTVNFADSEVITVPIDDTLSNTGEAADAKAVGDALALKADKSELSAAITVDGQEADAPGALRRLRREADQLRRERKLQHHEEVPQM